MDLLTRLACIIIRKSFHTSVWVISKFNDMAAIQERTGELSRLPEGTLGRDIADCLQKHELKMVAGYESHDLKHVLLNYKMTPLDEIRLQAFMLGNGNYSIPSFAIFTFGAFLLPLQWRIFYRDYQEGCRTQPISTWTIDEFAHCNTNRLRQMIRQYKPEPARIKLLLLEKFSLLIIVAGVFGMVLSLPFLFSGKMIDIVGAGAAFVAGALLVASGLISSVMISKKIPVRESDDSLLALAGHKSVKQ